MYVSEHKLICSLCLLSIKGLSKQFEKEPLGGAAIYEINQI